VSRAARRITSLRATLSNRAWNRRSGFCLALRYSTRWRARTRSGPSARLTELAELAALIGAPPFHHRAWMKRGSFALAGLCCPDRQRYYDPLGLPLDYRPLHGAAAYRPVLLPPPAGAGSRRVSPVPRTTFRPFHAPYAGRFLRTRSRLPGAFRGLRPVRAGSAPPWPPQAVNNYDAADFASCCGPAVRSSPLRTPPLGDARGFTTGDPGVSPDRTLTGWLP